MKPTSSQTSQESRLPQLFLHADKLSILHVGMSMDNSAAALNEKFKDIPFLWPKQISHHILSDLDSEFRSQVLIIGDSTNPEFMLASLMIIEQGYYTFLLLDSSDNLVSAEISRLIRAGAIPVSADNLMAEIEYGMKLEESLSA